jgi:hypothetical protein
VLYAETWTVCGQGSDGQRPGTEARVPACRAGQSVRGGQTVRVCAGAVEFADDVWISLPRGTPTGRRDPRVCLGISRPPKTPLNDIEPKRGED